MKDDEKTTLEEYRINNKTYRLRLFDKLDVNTAYLIGYLAGDGIFYKPTHKRNSRIGVSSSDMYIVYAMRDYFCPDNSVQEKWPYNNTRNIKATKYTALLQFSSKFSPVFNKYGILSLKEDRKLINVSKALMRYYVLGLFDADGHISWGYRKDRNRLWANIGFTHNSYHLLTRLQNYIDEELDISTTVRQRRDEHCYDMKFGKLENVRKFLNWLYQEEMPFTHNKFKEQKANEFLAK